MAVTVTVFSVLTACDGGGDGGGGGGIAGTSELKTGSLDGNYACVGGLYSLLFLTTGEFIDNQIVQGTYKRNVMFKSY
jgi:hypothetical protein